MVFLYDSERIDDVRCATKGIEIDKCRDKNSKMNYAEFANNQDFATKSSAFEKHQNTSAGSRTINHMINVELDVRIESG
jgi:hypothetical protein